MTITSASASASPSVVPPSRRSWISGWRLLFLAIAWFAALVVGVKGYERYTAPATESPRGQIVTVQRGSIAATVNTTGSVIAGTTAKLSFKASGRLSEVRVQVGDVVQAGHILARQDQSDLQLQVAQSRAQLASAEAKLAQMMQGSRPEEIAAAQSNLASAQAKLAQMRSGPSDADVQSAQASVASAKANLASAAAKLADLRAQPKPEDVRTAQLQLEKARNSLWAMQIDRDATCGNARNAEYQCNSANARVAAGDTDVTNATENLKKVSQPTKAEDIKVAEESVASAQQAYDSAVAKLQQVKSGANEADIAAAQASVDGAVSQLKLKQVPNTDSDLQAQRAAVEQNKAALGLAESNLKNATLVAPFNGTVSAVTMNVGEITAGSSMVTVVDPKALRVDATVDESDVAKLELGQVAEVSFDSLPARRFSGKVAAIAPSGTVQSGVVTYLVSLRLGDVSGLKSGMTANANIAFARRDNVLMLPNRAIRALGKNRVVEVVEEVGNQTRTVQVGLSNDQFTEILDGVREGEGVMIRNTTTVAPRIGGMQGAGGTGGGNAIMVPKQ